MPEDLPVLAAFLLISACCLAGPVGLATGLYLRARCPDSLDRFAPWFGWCLFAGKTAALIALALVLAVANVPAPASWFVDVAAAGLVAWGVVQVGSEIRRQRSVPPGERHLVHFADGSRADMRRLLRWIVRGVLRVYLWLVPAVILVAAAMLEAGTSWSLIGIALVFIALVGAQMGQEGGAQAARDLFESYSRAQSLRGSPAPCLPGERVLEEGPAARCGPAPAGARGLVALSRAAFGGIMGAVLGLYFGGVGFVVINKIAGAPEQAGAIFLLSVALISGIAGAYLRATTAVDTGAVTYGWLCATDQRLLFQTLVDVAERQEWSIRLEEAHVSAGPAPVFLAVALPVVTYPGELRIVSAGGTERFLVEEPHDWARAIAAANERYKR